MNGELLRIGGRHGLACSASRDDCNRRTTFRFDHPKHGTIVVLVPHRELIAMRTPEEYDACIDRHYEAKRNAMILGEMR